jgi:hypothetical protein
MTGLAGQLWMMVLLSSMRSRLVANLLEEPLGVARENLELDKLFSSCVVLASTHLLEIHFRLR